MKFIELLPIVGAPLLRSVAGWLENALRDGYIDEFEWARLGETVVRVSVIATGTYFGLTGFGLDVSVLGASAGALVLDFILAKIKK